MPTKRRLVERKPAGAITQAVVEMYREAKPLHAKRMACIQDEIECEGTLGRHCPDCRREMELSIAINRELKIKPWQYGPLEQLPENDTHPHRGLERARALQNELEAAING